MWNSGGSMSNYRNYAFDSIFIPFATLFRSFTHLSTKLWRSQVSPLVGLLHPPRSVNTHSSRSQCHLSTFTTLKAFPGQESWRLRMPSHILSSASTKVNSACWRSEKAVAKLQVFKLCCNWNTTWINVPEGQLETSCAQILCSCFISDLETGWKISRYNAKLNTSRRPVFSLYSVSNKSLSPTVGVSWSFLSFGSIVGEGKRSLVKACLWNLDLLIVFAFFTFHLTQPRQKARMIWHDIFNYWNQCILDEWLARFTKLKCRHSQKVAYSTFRGPCR